jgi:RNA-directed DNA polymerase
VTETPKDQQPQAVRKLGRGGQAWARWSWVEPEVWNERMLEALERGVRGGRWHSLIDKVWSVKSLRAAWRRVRENGGSGGVDKQTIALFGSRIDERLEQLHESLRTGDYDVMPVRRVWIPKGRGKLRPLGIPTIRDRVVQTSLRNVIEPIFEKKFLDCSYGFRPGRGCKDALREVDRLLEAGHTWVVDVDIEQYFDSIPHARLLKEVAREISDGYVLAFIEAYLKAGVMDGVKQWVPQAGTPQGAVISPLLANVYLHPVDEVISRDFALVRYADDMVILCRTREEAERALAVLKAELETRGLRLHPEKTRIADATTRPGFEFLGYRFSAGYRDPRDSSKQKLKEKIRTKTRRSNGESTEEIIRSVNASLRGWFEYFKHSSRHAFDALDSWVRMRLRSLLRKRDKRHGAGRGLDHIRWPNAYLDQLGLFSLVRAHELAIQSSKTIDRRAGCGRSARPVRREGRS